MPVPDTPDTAIEPNTHAADSSTHTTIPTAGTPRSSAVRIAIPAMEPPIRPPM